MLEGLPDIVPFGQWFNLLNEEMPTLCSLQDTAENP
jgi:hypothetical protein